MTQGVVTNGRKRRGKLDPQGIQPVSDRHGALVHVLAQLAVAEPEHGVADADDVLLRQHLAGDPLAVDVGPAVGAQVDDLEAAVRVTAQLSVMPGDIEVSVSAMSLSSCRPIRIVLSGTGCPSVIGRS